VHKALPLPGINPEAGFYFQREIKGVPVSLLFAADGKLARVIGFNRQLLAPSPAMPYRYGGAVGNTDLPDSIKQQLLHAAQQLTNAIGLRGLNSLDAMMDGEQLWVLEINPRLSASFDLYQAEDLNLFELHMQACAGNSGDWFKASAQALNLLSQKSKAHHVIYASYNLPLPSDLEWPEWVADRPMPGSEILAHSPVCTVLAEAENAESAYELIRARVKVIESMIGNDSGEQE
jgi:predicted ATP-grasp superfamily ATP-dependent carboligase